MIQEVVKRDGNRIIMPPGQKQGAERALRRRGPEGRRRGADARHAAQPADIGLIASLGIGEVRVKRRLRVAFFATGDELASIGTPLKEGEVYDSNRYTLHGMLARLGVEVDRPGRGAR